MSVSQWQQESDVAIEALLDTFDHGPIHVSAKTQAGRKVVGHFRPFGSTEQENINAYGISGGEVTVKSVQFNNPPEKFDKFIFNFEQYVAVDVVPVRGFANVIIAYRCFVRGK